MKAERRARAGTAEVGPGHVEEMKGALVQTLQGSPTPKDR